MPAAVGERQIFPRHTKHMRFITVMLHSPGMGRAGHFALAVMWIVGALAADAGAAEKLAILELEARGVEKALAQNLGSVIANAVRKQKRFEVIARDDIEKLMRFEESRQLAGSTANSGSIAAMAADLGIAKLLHGSLGRVGKDYILSLSLMDTHEVVVLASDATTVKGKDEALVDAAAKLVARLFELLAERERKK